MARKKLYVIIGDGRCGKSSLVRALTGVYRTASVEIGKLDKENSIIWTRVMPQSAQEAEIPPKDLVKELDKHSETPYALITIRLYEYKGFGPAIDYLDELSKHFDIERIVFMGRESDIATYQYKGVPFNVLCSSYSRPVNTNASMVRAWWNWL